MAPTPARHVHPDAIIHIHPGSDGKCRGDTTISSVTTNSVSSLRMWLHVDSAIRPRFLKSWLAGPVFYGRKRHKATRIPICVPSFQVWGHLYNTSSYMTRSCRLLCSLYALNCARMAACCHHHNGMNLFFHNGSCLVFYGSIRCSVLRWSTTRTVRQLEASLHRHLCDVSAVDNCPSCVPVARGMLSPTADSTFIRDAYTLL